MKGRILCCAIAMLTLVSAASYGQSRRGRGTGSQSLVFGVRPGFGIQSSYLGYSFGALIPYFGADLMAIGVKASDSHSSWYPGQSGELYRESNDTWELSGSAFLIIPHVGIKYSFSGEELRPYCFAGVFKAFPSVSVDGEEVYREYNEQGNMIYEDIDTIDLEKSEKDAIRDLLGIVGLNFGFGVDYPVSKRFSVAGEYGIRMFSVSSDYTHTDAEDWNGDGVDDWRDEWKDELSATLKLSYGAVVLTYYL